MNVIEPNFILSFPAIKLDDGNNIIIIYGGPFRERYVLEMMVRNSGRFASKVLQVIHYQVTLH